MKTRNLVAASLRDHWTCTKCRAVNRVGITVCPRPSCSGRWFTPKHPSNPLFAQKGSR